MGFLFIASIEEKKVKTSSFVILLDFQYSYLSSRKAVKEASANFKQKIKGFTWTEIQ